MSLSDATEAQIKDWFAEHGVHLCFCEKDEDTPNRLESALFALPTSDGKPLNLVAVTCPSCGFVSFYNADVMGVAH